MRRRGRGFHHVSIPIVQTSSPDTIELIGCEILKFANLTVVDDHRGERHVDAAATVQESKLDNAGRGCDDAALLLHQLDRRLQSPAGGDQIVEDDDPLTGRDRVRERAPLA